MNSSFVLSLVRLPLLLWAWTIAIAFCVGCGSPMYPVEGSIVFEDGKEATELNKGIVELQSIDVQPPVGPRGAIGPEGKFVLGTKTDNDGAPAGRYRVLVMPPQTIIDESKPLPTPVIDRKFQQFETSGLEVRVEPKPNSLKLTVERPKEQ